MENYIVRLMGFGLLILSIALTITISKIKSLKRYIRIREELGEVTQSSDVAEGYYDNVLEADISNNKLIGNNCMDLIKMLGIGENASFSECIEMILEKFIKDEYKALYKEQFDCNNLINRFENGEKKFSFVFEERADLVNYYWTKVTVCIYYSNITKSIKIISYVKNIQEEKEIELQLLRQANTDSLTGLLNKQACENKIKEISLNSQAKGKEYALLIIDIDKFKEINDTYGHIEGDKVIRQISKLLRDNFRENDIVGRIGGDEFMVLVDGYKNIYELESIINRLLNAVNHMGGFVSDSMKISISIGVSLCQGCSGNFEDLFLTADKALYRVKSNGRNNFEVASML